MARAEIGARPVVWVFRFLDEFSPWPVFLWMRGGSATRCTALFFLGGSWGPEIFYSGELGSRDFSEENLMRRT